MGDGDVETAGEGVGARLRGEIPALQSRDGFAMGM